MALNLTRVGTAAVVGIGSELLEPPHVQPVQLMGQNVSYAALLEMLAVVGGAGLQFFSPFTFPQIVDGAVEGGVALLAKRGTRQVRKQMASPMLGGFAQRVGASFMPQLAGASMSAAGQIGGLRNVPYSRVR